MPKDKYAKTSNTTNTRKIMREVNRKKRKYSTTERKARREDKAYQRDAKRGKLTEKIAPRMTKFPGLPTEVKQKLLQAK